MVNINTMDKDFLRSAIKQNRLRSLTSVNNKPQFPSMGQMAKNLGGEIVKNVQSVAAGNSLKADDNEANRRKSICHGCQYFHKSQDRCTKCGCYMAVKVYLKASNCPIGKW
jgi:uncharacterized paraquat-inducible protein A